MPVFYFDIRNAAGKDYDQEGQELSGFAEARRMAMEELTHLLRDDVPDGDLVSFTVTVRNANGIPVGTATTTLVFEDFGPSV